MQHLRFPTLAPLALALLAGAPLAQLEYGGRPVSDWRVLRAGVPTVELPWVDVEGLRAEDALREASGEPGGLRYGEVIPVELGLGAGAWETLPPERPGEPATRVWRLRVRSQGAYSLGLVFERFQLPEEGELFVYNDDRSVVRGAYTWLNQNPDAAFAIQPTPGDALTLEYREPVGVSSPAVIGLQGVIHDYVDVLGRLEAGACNVDVACAPALDDQIRSVVRTASGGVLCSGVLLNNTANDGTQLLLTAQHCGNLQNGIFLFGYQRPTCGGGTAPTSMAVQGAKLLVSDAANDFQLLRILPMVPNAYRPYLAGWSRSTLAPPFTFAIHHPEGDEKAICVDLDAPVTFGQARWRILKWEVGTTEVGSSGCPLFDPSGLVIGSLEGGFANCGNPSDDRFVRMDAMWAALSPWLDPMGLAPLALGGYDPLAQPPQPLTASATTPAGVPILQPGLGRDVRIVGTGFDASTTIAVDGVPVPAGSYGWVNPQMLELDFPQVAAVGTHTVTLTKGTEVVDLPVQVVPVSSPKLQLGNGEDGNTVLLSVDWKIAGQPGDMLLVAFSTSSLPSVHPAWTLAYGNQFTELVLLGFYTVPPSGLIELTTSTTGFFVANVWSTATLLNGVFPALQSNLQHIFVVL